MLIQLTTQYDNKTTLIDTEKILYISGVEERWIGNTGNMRHGWDYYIIKFIDNSELDVRNLKADLEIQREKLIQYWNKDKKEIVKI